jgi:DNA replication protein DnaC
MSEPGELREIYPPHAEMERLIEQARGDQMTSLADTFKSLLGQVLPGGAVIERPVPKLEWLIDLESTESLELRLRIVDAAQRSGKRLAEMPTNHTYWRGWFGNEIRKLSGLVERARHRDAIQLGRPPGCWCLGLGFYGGRGYCGCPDGAEKRRDHSIQEVAYQAERQREQRMRRWQALAIPPDFEQVTLDSILDLDPSKAPLLVRLRGWFEGERSLLLHGKAGRGKTGLAAALLKMAVGRKGQSALMVDVPLTLDRVRASNRPDHDEDQASILEPLYTVEVLLLDDLGAHKDTPFVIEKLRTLINYRVQHRKRTIVTTNLFAYDLPEQLDERIGSRLLNFEVVEVDGDDLRLTGKAAGYGPAPF